VYNALSYTCVRLLVLVTISNFSQIEKNDMGGACSMYGEKERCIQDFGGET
jgi:hypothetical protein